VKYYIDTISTLHFEDAVQMVKDELKKEGFGILTTISIQDKLKETIGVDFRRYLILGACNPAYAYKALSAEDKIGTMLPCNVIIQETTDGKVEVAAVNPLASMMSVDNPALFGIAKEIEAKMKRVISNIL
jgi:uncharacterized protein (DUF302 family)